MASSAVKKLFWRVEIHRDKAAMRKAYRDYLCRGHRCRGNDDRFGAIVMPCAHLKKARNGRWVADQRLGKVLFARTQIRQEEITHESVHMATGFIRRTRGTAEKPGPIDLGSGSGPREEDVAYAAGNSARQIVNAGYRAGLWR